jgi:hypothetical protein
VKNDDQERIRTYMEADGDIEKFAELVRVDERAKREWVGLTDEEIDNLWEMAQAWNAPKHFYILIAAKLKERNT